MRVSRILTIVLFLGMAASATALLAHLFQKRHETLVQRIKDEVESALRGTAVGPVELYGRVRLRHARGWSAWEMVTRQGGGRALITLKRNGETVRLFDDGQRLWRVSEPAALLGASPQKVDWPRLANAYRISVGSRRVIAGRFAYAFQIVSRRTGRPAETLWIARPNSILLARESYDAEGHLVSASEVTRVLPEASETMETELDQVVAGLPKPPPDRRVSDEVFERQAGFTPLRPSFLPAGYRELGLYARTCPRGRVYAELIYTDGLRVLTIHERPGGGPRGGPGWRFGQGRTGVHSNESAEPVLVDEGLAKTVRVRRGQVRIFVTGDLTHEEMLRLVNSIR